MPRGVPLDVVRELVDGFDHCCRVTELLVSAVPLKAWRAEPPDGHGRTIAAIVAHMQSLRRTFAQMGGATGLPSLDRLQSTPVQAARALKASRGALRDQFAASLREGRARVRGMPRRTVDMLLYITQHEAHHRGQISRQLGALGIALPKEDVTRLWGWRKLG